jgi:hypothetical protein
MPDEMASLDDLLKGILDAEYHALALLNDCLALAREDLASRVNLVLTDLTAWRSEVLSRQIQVLMEQLQQEVLS